MKCGACAGSGNRRGIVVTVEREQPGGVLWGGGSSFCPCCEGAGWVTPEQWRRWRGRPKGMVVHVLNAAARERRGAS